MPDRVSLDGLSGDIAEVFDGTPRIVRRRLDAGEGIPGHSHPGETVVVHALSGRLSLDLDGEAHDLAASELIRFDGARTVAIEAVEDAAFLVILVADAR